MESQPAAAMVYGRTQWWYSWTGKAEDIRHDFIPELGVPPDTLIPPPTLLTLFLKTKAMVPCTCSVLVRRRVALAAGGFEATFRRLYTDQAFYAKIGIRAPVIASANCLDRYRQRADSCYSGGKRTGEREAARRVYLNWLKGYLSAQRIDDPELWDALNKKRRQVQYPALYEALEISRRCLPRSREIAAALERTIIPSRIRRWFGATVNSQTAEPRARKH